MIGSRLVSKTQILFVLTVCLSVSGYIQILTIIRAHRAELDRRGVLLEERGVLLEELKSRVPHLEKAAANGRNDPI